jgi:hypothetical protein
MTRMRVPLWGRRLGRAVDIDAHESLPRATVTGGGPLAGRAQPSHVSRRDGRQSDVAGIMIQGNAGRLRRPSNLGLQIGGDGGYYSLSGFQGIQSRWPGPA